MALSSAAKACLKKEQTTPTPTVNFSVEIETVLKAGYQFGKLRIERTWENPDFY